MTQYGLLWQQARLINSFVKSVATPQGLLQTTCQTVHMWQGMSGDAWMATDTPDHAVTGSLDPEL